LPLAKRDLIEVYRNHAPELQLADGARELLQSLKSQGHRLGLLTDGRSTTQRNKIRALGLDKWIDEIVISEEFGSCKSDERNYRHFEEKLAGAAYAYVGDNLDKDFFTPNRMNWITVGVRDRGAHIHSQILIDRSSDCLPEYWIEPLASVRKVK